MTAKVIDGAVGWNFPSAEEKPEKKENGEEAMSCVVCADCGGHQFCVVTPDEVSGADIPIVAIVCTNCYNKAEFSVPGLWRSK